MMYPISDCERASRQFDTLVSQGVARGLSQEKATVAALRALESRSEEPAVLPPGGADRREEELRSAGLTQEEIAFCLDPGSVKQERLELMRGLPRGAPLGIPNQELDGTDRPGASNHCYIISFLQCMAAVCIAQPQLREEIISALSPSFRQGLLRYLKEREERQEGTSAACSVDTRGLENELMELDHAAFKKGLQADAIEVFLRVMRGDIRAYLVDHSAADSLDALPPVLLCHSDKTKMAFQDLLLRRFGKSQELYRLVAMNCPSGTVTTKMRKDAHDLTASGHHSSYVRDANAHWFHCSGSFVAAADREGWQKALSNPQCLLVYVRCPRENTSATLPLAVTRSSVTQLPAEGSSRMRALAALIPVFACVLAWCLGLFHTRSEA